MVFNNMITQIAAVNNVAMDDISNLRGAGCFDYRISETSDARLVRLTI